MLEYMDKFKSVGNKLKTTHHENDNHISYELFLLTLSNFQFLWSAEHINTFLKFLQTTDLAKRQMYYFCFTIHPLTIIYSKNCLKNVYYHFHSMNVEELLEDLKLSMRKYAPLFPSFLKEILNTENEKNGQIFFERILHPFVTAPFIFGLTNPDFILFYAEKSNAFVDRLKTFFSSEDGDRLITEIISCQDSVSTLPSENLLFYVYPEFKRMTVFNLKSFEATEGVIQKPIISTSLFQLILDNNETQKETVSVTKKQDTLNSLVREFLLHSYLVKLDRTYDNVSNYFQDIASFSSFEVNPELEECYYDLLDELSSSPTTISEISKNIEHEMANETNPGEQTLNTLSEYSQQSQYIKGLQEIAAKIRKCASNTYDFYYMYRVYFELLSEIREHRPSTDEIIQNPQTFVNFFCECSEKFSEIEKKKISSRKIKNLFYVLMYDTKAWETFISQPSLVEYDKEIQRFVSEESESLLCYHQLDFLDIYKEDKSKLEMFNSEFKLAFECAQPFERISHIHSAYEILGGLLRLQDIGEIGADQIVPFALLATVYANPLGLASTGNFIAEFISPLLSGNSPVDHAEEYSLVQFLSTFRFLEEKYNEKKKANENK